MKLQVHESGVVDDPSTDERRVKKSEVRQIFRKKTRKTSTDSNKTTTKSRFAYDPFDIERKDDENESLHDENSSIVSRVGGGPTGRLQRPSKKPPRRPEPADVVAARDELDHILQQQDEIEFRKKEINEKLKRQKREDHGLEETMLRQASTDHHREVIKSMCFLHEYQIRNMELESMALMKEFLLQQKELETQRTDMRRRLVDEVVDLQKNVITGNFVLYTS